MIFPYNCEVLRESLFSILIFTLYINDIYPLTNYAPELYADDICLIIQHNNLINLKLKVNEEIKSVSKWRNAHKLTLNISKFNIILLHAKKHKKNHNNSFPDILVELSSDNSIVKVKCN